jgi:hypothetical protein
MLVGAIRWDGYAQLCHSRWAHVFVSVDLSRHTEVPYTVLQPCVMLTATTNSQVVGAVFRDCSTCIGASLPMLPLGIRASSEEICEKNVACMLYWWSNMCISASFQLWKVLCCPDLNRWQKNMLNAHVPNLCSVVAKRESVSQSYKFVSLAVQVSISLVSIWLSCWLLVVWCSTLCIVAI